MSMRLFTRKGFLGCVAGAAAAWILGGGGGAGVAAGAEEKKPADAKKEEKLPTVAEGVARGPGYVMATAKVKSQGGGNVSFMMTLLMAKVSDTGKQYWTPVEGVQQTREEGEFSTKPFKTRGGKFQVKCTGANCTYEVLLGFRADSASNYKVIGRSRGKA